MLTAFGGIEPFAILLALLPLIAYLLVFSVIRLSGRVLVTTGGRDIAALAMAISGLLAVGPAELFFPADAALMFGPMVWVVLAIFYTLIVTLIVLSSTPRLVVYGRTPSELFEPLLAAAQRIDPAAGGDPATLQVELPTIGIRLRLDGNRGIDFAQILAFEPNVSVRFWNHLLSNLRSETRDLPAPLPRRGFGMLIAVVLIGGFLMWQSFGNRELLVEGFRQWLWR